MTEGFDELPSLSVFYKDDKGNVFHTYSSHARGNDEVIGAFIYLDITPKAATKKRSWTGCAPTTNIRSIRRSVPAAATSLDGEQRRENQIIGASVPLKQKITPCLWFDGKAKEAANFYVSIFKNSRITAVSHYGDAGPGPRGGVMTISFELDGQSFTGLNGGPMFNFTEAISMIVNCNERPAPEDGSKVAALRWHAHVLRRL
jgi:3-demethylubiquinone-9 3-methyltransferase/Bacterial protein of unknown function (DUF899)